MRQAEMTGADRLKEEHAQPRMIQRKADMLAFKQRFKILMEKTGFGSQPTSHETLHWFDKTEFTDDKSNPNSIYWREDFIRQDGQLILNYGESLYSEFMSLLNAAAPYLSRQSRERWLNRLYDTTERGSDKSSFRRKLEWVRRELSNYVKRWIAVAKERDELAADPRFREWCSLDPSLKRLENREAFLDLHYSERSQLVARAKAVILAMGKNRIDLYTEARNQLNKAVQKKILAPHKVGIWLERIFKSNAKREKIDEFLHGNSVSSLPALMGNWSEVKRRYDGIVEKIQQRGRNPARGMNVLPLHAFLGMHYAQRLRYVEETERRIADANDIRKELPIFLQIRHSLDMKEWDDAAEQIVKADGMQLTADQRERLQSMRRYLTQMSAKHKKPPEKATKEKVAEAHKTIDEIFHHTPATLQPMLLHLLRSPHANRNIHQFRWIVYNNKWCRDHHYLNRKKMLIGASRENEERTHQLARRGEDVGLHDSLTEQNADLQFIRKKEYARNKATLLHVDVKSSAPLTLARWLEKEQDPRVLYWATFCGNEDHDPKSDEWHNELFFNLTKLRSATRTLEQAGYMYASPRQKLVAFTPGTQSAPPVILN